MKLSRYLTKFLKKNNALDMFRELHHMFCHDISLEDIYIDYMATEPETPKNQEFFRLARKEFDRDFFFGDTRCCPNHPNAKTSSDDGMHDGVCGECEYEMSIRDAEEDEALIDGLLGPIVDPKQCSCRDIFEHRANNAAMKCMGEFDDIPF